MNPNPPDAVSPQAAAEDMAALAKGGRTNFFGFLLRLLARIPFLFIAGQLYGAEAIGRFASALVVVELLAMICSMGEKRGLAQRLTEGESPHSNLVLDGFVLALLFSSVAAAILWFFPAPMFPNGMGSEWDRLLVLAIPGFALTEIALAAQAYKFDIATTVRARAIVEPWSISIMAGVLYFTIPDGGLAMAYLASIYAGLVTALWPFLRTYGRPEGWRPHPAYMARLVARALPLATADAIEWGTRRLDIFILGLFASPVAVGIYYMAQQVASLPQKLKTSFEPVLGPVITKNLQTGNFAAIAAQVCQVGFWIIAAQAGIALALGIPGEALMGLFGPDGAFVGGTGALAFLLAAEVVAATAVVSEAALVYVARLRNFWISIGTITLQAALTAGLLLSIERWGPQFGWGDGFMAAGAAISLMIALGLASVVKALLLSRILGHPINNWRWALVWAAAPAIVVGYLATLLPEWLELLLGIPLILGTYGLVIWHRGFGPEDRVLFRKNIGG
ncbi:oligosaccharide flippase family protein [Parerythrobacter aurantius]|uniref:lipopolysaccharide biosynthesis protein n=1 Tax=Parerythrobacter aurantius TaxID=3127706 RepID=UPI00324E7236